MILEIISYIIIVVMGYIIWNLYNKVDFLENVLDSNYAVLKSIQDEMSKIDSTGHFKADDEVGTTFDALKNEIDRLDNLVEEKNNAA
jgi:hypothetical protein